MTPVPWRAAFHGMKSSPSKLLLRGRVLSLGFEIPSSKRLGAPFWYPFPSHNEKQFLARPLCRNVSGIFCCMKIWRIFAHIKSEGAPSVALKLFMWVAPSPLFSRTRGPHIKNFRLGSEMGDGGCVSLCLCAFFALAFEPGRLKCSP